MTQVQNEAQQVLSLATRATQIRNETVEVMGKEKEYKVANGTYYHRDTPTKVITTLESLRQSEVRVRLFYGDPETGLDYLQEWDTQGRISRSTGPVKIPLLVPRKDSPAGDPILGRIIVRITVSKKDVYRHPLYRLPALEVREGKHVPGYPEFNASVYANGRQHANFHTVEQAHRWVEYIKGNRNNY